MNEVVKRMEIEPRGPSEPVSATTPMEMIDRALSRGADPDTLGKLLALQERWEASQGRKAFDQAIAAAKAEITPIIKNKTVDFTGKTGIRTHYQHEDLAQIARQVDPILSKHGLSYRYRTQQAERKVTVTCILSHRDGYSEETSLDSAPDESGNKNHIQAVGSAITFLQRYTLKAALGLAAAADDDGQAVGAKPDAGPVTTEQLKRLGERIDELGVNEAKFLEYLRVDAIENLPASRFNEAMFALNSSKQAKGKGTSDA